MHPKTDIICLVHNKLPVTKGFVDNLFKYTENFNLIFVNNGSTDGTGDFLAEGEKQNKWKVITSDKNLGVIKGRNLGAKSVISDYFVNLDNDQYVMQNWLQILHDYMNKGFDIVGCEAWTLFPPKTKGHVVLNNMEHGRSYYPYKKCDKPTDKFTYIGCGGMLIKKKVYDTIGLFDERFNPAYFEDPDYNFRAIQNGFKLGWCINCPIRHLAHQTMNNQDLFDKNVQFQKSWKAFSDKWYPYFPEGTK